MIAVPTEREEAKLLVAYMRVRGLHFTHIANETGSGRSAKMQGIRNKQQGMSKGFPDYLVVLPGQLIAIELKRIKGSVTSPEQLEWIERLNAVNVPARICKGANEAIDFIEEMRGK